MEYKELVIRIPDNYDLSNIQNGSIASKVILDAVANGTPLPEGHGRLIDADKLRAVYTQPHLVGFDEIIEDIDSQPTVLEGEEYE